MIANDRNRNNGFIETMLGNNGRCRTRWLQVFRVGSCGRFPTNQIPSNSQIISNEIKVTEVKSWLPKVSRFQMDDSRRSIIKCMLPFKLFGITPSIKFIHFFTIDSSGVMTIRPPM